MKSSTNDVTPRTLRVVELGLAGRGTLHMVRPMITALSNRLPRSHMLRGLGFTLLLAALGLAPPTAEGAAPEVQTDAGIVRGETDDGVAVFRGIPYAAPPVGRQRWQPPRPVEPWPDVRDATDYGPICRQRASSRKMIGDILELNGVGWFRRTVARIFLALTPRPKESEDCLYLNVRTTNVDGDTPQPVMVWIHGGGHQMGSGSFPMYNTNALPKRGVVLVTLNYRLGIFGFLAHPELSAKSRSGASGNYGLLDQMAALRWVRKNIASFGGDPDKVTIFGESAGGHAVGQLMASRLARGLFHRAIAQSGSGAQQYLRLREDVPGHPSAESVGLRVADGRDITEMRALDADDLVEIWREDDGRTRAFHPCVDGAVLARSVAETFARGEQAPVPLLIGSNSDEGRMFYRNVRPWRTPLAEIQKTISSVKDYEELVQQAFGDDADAILRHYPAASDDDLRDAVMRLYGESYFVANGVHLARSMSKVGRPAYLYYFARPTPNTPYGALHTADLDFIFDGARVFPKVEGDEELKALMADYWVSFAKGRDPNGAERPAWPRFDKKHPQWMVLDREVHPEPLPNPDIFEIFDRRRFRLMTGWMEDGE